MNKEEIMIFFFLKKEAYDNSLETEASLTLHVILHKRRILEW